MNSPPQQPAEESSLISKAQIILENIECHIYYINDKVKLRCLSDKNKKYEKDEAYYNRRLDN